MRNGGKQVRKAVTPQMIKLIHTLKSSMNMSDDQYRAALYESFKVESSKDLTLPQAVLFADRLKAKAIAMDVWKKKRKGHRSQGLKERAGYATPAQLDYIVGLWQKVSKAPEGDQTKALRHFVSRMAGVSDLRFLTSEKVSVVITALKNMHSRSQEGRG
ncbi:MAG: regulatory protein GemA [Deltaproteobacteria bacterium]|nr:regulatory protein GemA [Deltaproteobacteria bacterium]